MADASAAVSVVLSKLGTLHQEQYKLSRRVRRDATAVMDELRETQELVATASEAEAEGELYKASHPVRSDAEFLVRRALDILEDLEPRTAPGYCSSTLRELCYDAEAIVDATFLPYVEPPASGRRRRLRLFRGATDWLAMASLRLLVSMVCGQLKRQATDQKSKRAGKFAGSFMDCDGRHRPPASSTSTLVGVDRQQDEVAKLLLHGERNKAESVSRQFTVITITGHPGMGKTTLADEVYRTVATFFDCRAWVPVSPSRGWKNILIDILRQVCDDAHAAEGMGELDLVKKIGESLQHKRYLIVLDDASLLRAWDVIASVLPRNSLGSKIIITAHDSAEFEGRSPWDGHTYRIRSLMSFHDSESARILFHRRIFGSTISCPPDLVDIADKILFACSGVPLAITLVSGVLANKQCTRKIWDDVYNYVAAPTRDDTDRGTRNIVLLAYHSLPHYLKTCLLSKLVRDNFVTLLDKGKPAVSKPTHKEVHRLSITSEDHGIPESMATSNIRSLFVFGGVMTKHSFKKLVSLRVLDLEGCNDLKNHHIVEIVGLKHLWYLSIKDTSISELPDQIGQLQQLTTLDLRGTEVQAIPTSIVQLRSLTHLLCDKMRFSEWIGKMTTISCLSQFDIFQSEVGAVEELGNMSELRELKLQSLCIDGSDSSVDILDHLHHPLEQLQRIQLSQSCYLSSIPEWFSSLLRLAYVCTSVKEIKNEDLQLLSQLASLRHLYLSSKVLPTEKLVISSEGFPVLKTFQLDSARADLTFEPQALQKLEELLLSVH
ncbi:hypothetical protein EJB05_26572, partial [Eragrostis curvula]